MLSCTKAKDLPILPIDSIKDDSYNYEAIENACAFINYGFADINAIARALRDGESIVSIKRGENNENTMSFLSGKETDFYDWHGNVLACPVIGLSLNESGDGKILTLPKFTLSLSLDVSKLAFKKGGDIHNVHYELSNVMDKATLEAEVSNGWQVSITPETSTSGTITITAPETIEETTITITAKESDRTAKCELKCGKPMFYLPQKEFKLGYEGKNLSVPVKTNLNFFIKIPDDAQTWIALVAEETTDEKIVLRVSENEEAFSRDATILCLDDEGVVWDKFSVSQNWGENKIFEVQNPEAGGLQEYIKTRNMSNVKKLKISGPLNDNDFLFLRGMRSLEYLDVYDVEAYSLPKGCFKREYYSWQCEKIILPKTLTAISEECFYCTSIKEVRIPVSCETIGASAFERCSSLNSVSFENGSGLKTISSSAFAICQSLKTITIPASCETIGDNTFSRCSSLTDFSCAGESALTSVGAGAFKYCGVLHRIDMQGCKKLAAVGSKAFDGDDQIYSFQIGAVVPPTCPTDAFGNVGEYSVLKVPAGSEETYNAASGWGDFYKIIADE